MSKFLKFIVNVFLVVAILTAAAILVPPILGVNTTIVDTAGMDTNLPLGSVTYSVNVPVTKLQAGDEVLKENGTSTYAYIIEEGDAGTGKYKVVSAVDRDSVTEITLRNTVSLVKLSIPYIGYVVVAMQTMEGIIIIVLVVLFIIILFILSELWKPKDDDDDDDSLQTDHGYDTDGDAMVNAGLASDPEFNGYEPAEQENAGAVEFDRYSEDVGPEEDSGIFGEEAPAPRVQELFDEENNQPTGSADPADHPAQETFETAEPGVFDAVVNEQQPVEGEFLFGEQQAAEVFETPAVAAPGEMLGNEAEPEVSAEPQEWIPEEEDIPQVRAEEEPFEAASEESSDSVAVQEENLPDYEEERAEFLEPNQFIAVDRLTLEEILEQARQKGGEPEVNKDDISGVNIVDYSKLI